MMIGEIQRVTDLAENERAFPEPDLDYGLRSMDNTVVDTTVKFVVRRRDQLIAKGSGGEDFPVSGVGAFVLTPQPVAAFR